jgi:hypothetical protein
MMTMLKLYYLSFLAIQTWSWKCESLKQLISLCRKTKLVVRKRTIPTERPPLVGEVSANVRRKEQKKSDTEMVEEINK